MRVASIARYAMLAAAAGVGLCAMPAKATTLYGSGFANGYETFSVTAPSASGVPTGAFEGTLDGSPFVFFCVELTQYFNFGVTYTDYTESQPSDSTFTLLSELFTEGFAHALDSTDNSAAFQLAIWEIRYEGGSPTDLRNGTFQVLSDNGHTPTVDGANYLLTHLPSTGLYTITLLHSPDHQDFVFGSLTQRDAPEPLSIFLVGVALGAMALVWHWQFRRPRRSPIRNVR